MNNVVCSVGARRVNALKIVGVGAPAESQL